MTPIRTTLVTGLLALATGCATTGTVTAPVVTTPPSPITTVSPAAVAEPFGKLSVDEVAALIRAGEASIYDDNGEGRYAAGHLPGAVWMPFSAVTAEKLPADKSRKLVFYCANERCSACHKAAAAAVALGHTQVFIMPAGIAGWEKAGQPVER